MTNSNQTKDWEEHDDDIGRAVRSLPNPGQARIAATVMQRIRQSNEDIVRLRPRGIAWGFASSLAGVFLGIFLANAIPESSLIQQASQSDAVVYSEATGSSDDILVELTDEFDLFIWEMSTNNEVNNE
ncbi:MAG: hypothetical protein HQ568_04915 [Calditrichaeota bacterium]|nr:hypothetical protein [Calditrichota bacterium]